MTTRESPFGDAAFTVAEGAAHGLGRGAMAGVRFERPFHGVRRWAAYDVSHAAPRPGANVRVHGRDPGPTSAERMRRRCEALAARLRPGQFFSHETCLVLAGAPTPRFWEPVVHVSAYRPASPPRTVGVVGHRLQARSPAGWTSGSLPIEHPARAWVQASRHWRRGDLIAAADFLVLSRRGLITIDELRHEAKLMRGRAVDDILDQVCDGAESSEETRLRLALVRDGLPEPALNRELFTASGVFVARLDLSFPRYKVAAEYDGRGHAFDVAQFARDADRWDAIRAEGWDHVRILSHHLRGDGRAATSKVRLALRRAGWRPG